jgi:GTP-binding protein HflX
LLSDTVGFIQKLPHHLGASFHATLAEVREADLLLHVVDAGDAEAIHRVQVVRSVLKEIGAGEIEELLVLNKCDRLLDKSELAILMQRLDAHVAISALSGDAVEDLSHAVEERMRGRFRRLALSIPASDGKTLALVSQLGTVLSREYRGNQCFMQVSIPTAAAPEFERFVVPT